MHDRDFKLHYSRQYALLISLGLLATTVILFLLPVLAWLKGFLLLILIVYGIYMLRFPVLPGLRYTGSKEWHLQMPDRIDTAKLSGHSTITRWFAVLRFQCAGHYWPRTFIVFPDSLPQGDYRRLLVVLNFSGR